MKKNILALVILSATTAPAFADSAATTAPASAAPVSADNTTSVAPASARNFIGGAVGTLSGYPDSTGDIVYGLVGNGWTSASASQKTSTTSYSVYGGQWLSERLGWEVGYGAFGSVDGSFTASAGLQSYNGSYKYSATTVYGAVLGAIPLGSGKLYGKVGLHSTSTQTDYSTQRYILTTLVSTGTASATKSGTGLVLGAGYEYPLNKNWAVRADMTMFNGAQFVSVADFTMTKSQTLIQTAVGLDYSF